MPYGRFADKFLIDPPSNRGPESATVRRMTNLRTRLFAAAAAGGLVAVGAIGSMSPATAVYGGPALTIRCDRFVYNVGQTAQCMLTHVTPGGPNNIELVTPQIGAAGDDGAAFALAAVVAQEAPLTYEQPVGPLRVPVGLYQVKGTSADEVAFTTLRVVNEGEPTAFSIVVNPDGTITIRNGQPGCSVTIFADGQPIGTVTIGDDGSATFKPTTPVKPGTKLTAKQTESDTCTALESNTVTVAGDEPGIDTPATPTTGANVALGLTAGLAAMGLGGGLYAASRRKKV